MATSINLTPASDDTEEAKKMLGLHVAQSPNLDSSIFSDKVPNYPPEVEFNSPIPWSFNNSPVSNPVKPEPSIKQFLIPQAAKQYDAWKNQ